ncbi:protein ImuA [Sphingomonas sp. G-3-2-10]|uniref:ImuA family protein n=1 Tax=Sphingomonas sp. G-3-2-10 TaxID=2728838 RepID=UPI00146AE052|nr:protein ImuA [Sphingomonas sp. G-3-2-10]NML06794.1 protein ImuA [Sphingomonas sp. G-3-2-10]
MQSIAALAETDRARLLAELKARIAVPVASNAPLLPFGIEAMDSRLGGGGLDGGGLHEVAAASPTLGDDAAATLFVAGAAARFAVEPNASVAWALTRFDLYAPGLEQAGLSPGKLLYCEGRDEVMALALAEDCLRDGSFAAVVAEVKTADQTATRRLQLAAADGRTPMLLLRRWARAARDPLEIPSAACTRWRIGCAPSVPLPHAGVGRSCWSVDLVRQRGGNPFSLIVEACDGKGRLALLAPARDRAAAAGGADLRAA